MTDKTCDQLIFWGKKRENGLIRYGLHTRNDNQLELLIAGGGLMYSSFDHLTERMRSSLVGRAMYIDHTRMGGQAGNDPCLRTCIYIQCNLRGIQRLCKDYPDDYRTQLDFLTQEEIARRAHQHQPHCANLALLGELALIKAHPPE